MRQKFFLCSRPQSLEGLEGGRRRIGVLGELGEVFFCTSDQLSVAGGDQQLEIHGNGMVGLAAVEHWWIVSCWSVQRRRGWRWVFWASLPPEALGEPRPVPGAGPGESHSSHCSHRCCYCSVLPPPSSLLPPPPPSWPLSDQTQVLHSFFHFSPEWDKFLQSIFISIVILLGSNGMKFCPSKYDLAVWLVNKSTPAANKRRCSNGCCRFNPDSIHLPGVSLNWT